MKVSVESEKPGLGGSLLSWESCLSSGPGVAATAEGQQSPVGLADLSSPGNVGWEVGGHLCLGCESCSTH